MAIFMRWSKSGIVSFQLHLRDQKLSDVVEMFTIYKPQTRYFYQRVKQF